MFRYKIPSDHLTHSRSQKRRPYSELGPNTTRSKMEQGKSRYNTLLAFAVSVNLLLSLSTIGFGVFKIGVLEEQLLQLQNKSSATLKPETRENYSEGLTHREKRSFDYGKEPKSCVSCHNACVKLFGLGASAKVRDIRQCLIDEAKLSLIFSKISKDQKHNGEVLLQFI